MSGETNARGVRNSPPTTQLAPHRRRPWAPIAEGDAPVEWTRVNIAQLCYQPSSRRWTLYWADRNSRWHRYDDVDPTTDLDALIAEIDTDPTCIIFG